MDCEDVPTEQTLRFVQPHLPKGGRVLEVGCGTGALARRLLDLGFSVAAVDRDPDAVRAARDRGVPAVEADFLTFRGGPFDAVLFTRSLHHIHPLELALDRAHALLAPGGTLLAEEFAVDQIDRDTARWYYDAQALLEAFDLLKPDPDAPVGVTDPVERWRVEHVHEPPLHGGRAMLAAIRDRFKVASASDAPYLYRYLCARLRDPGFAPRIFELERRRVDASAVRALGLRLVAGRRPS